jgi:hypothetical protein
MTAAAVKWPACDRLWTVAPAGYLPTALTPFAGHNRDRPPVGHTRATGAGIAEAKIEDFVALEAIPTTKHQGSLVADGQLFRSLLDLATAGGVSGKSSGLPWR